MSTTGAMGAVEAFECALQMSCVTLGATPRDVPHLTRRGGQWVVLIRLGAPAVFAAMRWADWKNGRHDWYYARRK